MPIARFEMPDGRIARFEVPEGTTPEQAQSQISEMVSAGGFESEPQVEQDPSLLDRVGQVVSDVAAEGLGNIEAAAAIGSGMVAQPVSGIIGLGAEALGYDGAGAVGATQEAMTYQPRGEEGQERLQQIGSIAEYIPDIAGGAGELAYDVTGSPAVAAGAEAVVTVLPELIGLGAMRGLKVGSRLIDDAGRPTKQLRKALDRQGLVYDNLSPQAKAKIPVVADQSFITGQSLVPDTAKKALIEQAKAGGRDDSLAGLAVVGDNLKADRFGLNALRQGYAPGFVQSVKTATPETKSQMKRMLDISRRIKKQERVGLDVRPGDVVGNAVSKRVRYIRDSANDARKDLDFISKNSLSGKTIDQNIVAAPLTNALDDLGVILRDSGSPKPDIDFSQSIITKDRGSQKAIRDAVDLLSDAQKTGSVDALSAHKLKRQLDNIIDFNKKSSRGLGEDGRKVLKTLRAGLNDSVRAVDADYARVNDILSKSLTALDDFDKASGAAIDIFGKGADSAIGTKMRGLMSNIQGRVNLENAVNQLDSVARDLSIPKSKQVAIIGSTKGRPARAINLNDDIKDLAMFANALDARFGAVAKSSFQGNIEQAINRVLNQGIAQEAIMQGAGKTANAVNKIRGINEFNAYEAMQDLLSR